MSESKTFELLRELILREAGHLLTPEEGFIGLFDKQGVMEFPYAPENGVTRLEGEREMRDYFAMIGDLLEIDEFIHDQTYLTADQQTVILEFHCHGKLVPTNASYDQKYISVISISNGKIIRYKDYWNPDVIQKGLGNSWETNFSDS